MTSLFKRSRAGPGAAPEIIAPSVERNYSIVDEAGPKVADTDKSRWDRMWPVIACGSGLFSDGYINGVYGSVYTILGYRYGTAFTKSPLKSNFASINFVGIVVGQLLWGWTTDHWSRKWTLLTSTLVIIVFQILATGAYGGGSLTGLINALTAYRFLTGIGIGGEYPAGSVACSESTGELKAGTRNRWFIFFTNLAIDVGFVVGAIVPMILILITGQTIPSHLSTAWRVCLGLGIIPPLSLLWARWKLQEPEAFKREALTNTRTPWFLVIKFYWFRLAVVAIIWFIYDFSAYGFSFYSSAITSTVLPSTAPLWKVFGWNTVINLFYVPGAFAGAFVSDWIGPRKTLVIGVLIQALMGFLIAGVYSFISEAKYIAAFCVMYGLFLSFGEFGPGDNIGLLASKTCATGIRGQYYAIAAATGKIGAYIALWCFPIIGDDGGVDDSTATGYTTKGSQNLFWVASPLALLAPALAFFFLPEVGQDTIDHEDRRFRAFLQDHGYDTRTMGIDPLANSANAGSNVAYGPNGVQYEKSAESPDEKLEYPKN